MKTKTWKCDLGTIVYTPMGLAERMRFAALLTGLQQETEDVAERLEALAKFVEAVEAGGWIKEVDLVHEGEEAKSWDDLNTCSYGLDVLLKFVEVFTPAKVNEQEKKS